MSRHASIKPVKIDFNPDKPWMVSIPPKLHPSGKRVRRFFSSEKKAELYAKEERRRLADFGSSAGVIGTASTTEDAQRAVTLLEGLDTTLTAIVKNWLREQEKENDAITMSTAWDNFEEAKKGKSKEYRKQIKLARGVFEDIEDKPVTQITKPLVSLQVQRTPPAQANAHMRVIRAVLGLSVRRGDLQVNPLSGIEMREDTESKETRIRGGGVPVLTVEQATELMWIAEKTDPELVPYNAIGLFAGIRPGEMNRMTWDNISTEEQWLEVPNPKTGDPRHIDMEKNLVYWLKGVDKDGELVPKRNLRKRLAAIRKKAGLDPWPQDVMRHSYASYWRRQYAEDGRLVQYMGHIDMQMLKKHYLKSNVKADEAKKYWQILPTRKAFWLKALIRHHDGYLLDRYRKETDPHIKAKFEKRLKESKEAIDTLNLNAAQIEEWQKYEV